MIDTLRQYESDGLLYSQTHPTLPLIIWNYTPKVQYEGLWDDVTIMARGLVTDDGGNIISKGFSKFWNIEECKHTPTNDFEVFEKLDGQYIGVFWYEDQMVVNSRGSFTSPYAIEARRILDEKYPFFEKNWMTQYTYCFELTGFEQIVVSYPESDLILTGVFNNTSNPVGEEIPFKLIPNAWIKKVKKYSGLDYTNIKQFNWPNSEGFVVRFSNGDRCKIKFEDYVRLHRQMTNLSTTAIWEALKDGKPVSSILSDVPDELFDGVKKIEDAIIDEFLNIEKICRIKFRELSELNLSRKEFAQIVLKTTYSPGILFSMLDEKDYSQSIWKMIKPEFKKI